MKKKKTNIYIKKNKSVHSTLFNNCRERGSRETLSLPQLSILEKVFQEFKYLIIYLYNHLNITPTPIVI
jgi:hypothetical protein